MIRSKISRSFIVAIFIVMIIFLGYLDIRYIISAPTQSVSAKLIKLGYIFGIIALVLLYTYIKEKLYKIKMKRSHSLILRHIFISIAVVVTNILVMSKHFSSIALDTLICYIILTVITSFIIKKLIFNVSKSDILSVIATFSYSLLPIVFENSYIVINSAMIILFVFATILNLQILIDELKQKGIKTSKYLILSTTLGILMGITCVIGVNFLVWIIVSILLLIVTINLDNTHVNFPKKIMNSVTQQKREKLYSIERININKLLVCIFIALILMFFIYFIGNIIFDKIANMNNNILVHTINNNMNNNNSVKFMCGEISFTKFINDAKKIVQCSKSYYMTLFVYIILIEVLNILLKRRYDTKSTILKSIFVLIFIVTSMFNINVYIMQQLFSVMLMLIAIVNTSNIYLNREERVKMLVA